MLNWPLVDGWAQVVLLGIGVLGLVWLLWGSGRSWWLVRVPIALGAGLLAALLAKIVIDGIWRPWDDPLPWEALVAVGLTVTAVVLAVLGRPRWPRVVVTVLAVCCVAASSAAAVNQHYGQYPTIRALLGADLDNQVDFESAFVAADQLVTAPPGTPLAQAWTPPPGMPAEGVVTTVPIPGTRSGFEARDAWIYLPPAYLSAPRAELPVMIMMSGQPGDPRDWFDGGSIAGVLDRFADQHAGLAPVVVVVDHLGDPLANPGCIDSDLGNVFTYLTVDVPAWISDNLQVRPDTTDWAVGGLSSGGTCALTLALTAPEIYRTFLDISGEDAVNANLPPPGLEQLEPGSTGAVVPQQTAHVPPPDQVPDLLEILRTQKFPETEGFLVAGTDDTIYLPQAQRVVDAARESGLTIDYAELPGGHEWSVWNAGFERDLPAVAARLGLI